MGRFGGSFTRYYTYDEAAGPSIARILSSTPRSLNISRVNLKTSPRTSRLTISAFVARVPSYHASAEKPVKVPSSRTSFAMISLYTSDGNNKAGCVTSLRRH